MSGSGQTDPELATSPGSQESPTTVGTMNTALNFGTRQVSHGGGEGAEDALPTMRIHLIHLGTFTLWQPHTRGKINTCLG